jgi:sugar diacid utilization regulator
LCTLEGLSREAAQVVCISDEESLKLVLSGMPQGWNQIQINLADLVRKTYGTGLVETLRVTIHANCRIRRVYFADRLYR